MLYKILTSKVKEHEDKWYYGKLSSKKIREAGERFEELFDEQGPKRAADFYLWFHEDTKEYIQRHKKYSNLLKIIQFTIQYRGI